MGRRKPTKPSNRDPLLNLRPAFPGQYVTTIKLPSITQVATTTVTTGVLAINTSVDPTSVLNNFGGRFGSTFKEYRVIKAVLKMKTFSSTLPGQINAWVDETLSSAPTTTQANEYQGVTTFPAGANEMTHIVKWVPHSPTELAYVPIASASTNATFKIYTDNASFGSSIVATQYLSYQQVITIQFRGIL
jgi:hypothetical protein